jgi:glycosyltransferase involved in cell wall biosynthesis
LWFGHAFGVRSFLKENISRFDIVHLHELWSYPQFEAARLAHKYNIPVIVSPQGHLDPAGLSQSAFKKKLFTRFYLGEVLKRAAAIVVLNRREIAYATEFVRHAHNRIVVIPNGLKKLPEGKRDDLPKLAGKPYILFLSRIHPRKGVMELLEAYAASTLRREFDLVLGGSFSTPEFEEKLRRFVSKNAMTDSVRFPGIVFGEAKRVLMSNAAALALPSYSEGLPTILLDALQVGCPLLISNNCGIDEYLQKEGVALVSGIKKEEILKNLVKLWQNRDSMKRTASIRGPQIVEEHFSIEIIVLKYRELYNWILNPNTEFLSDINQRAI